MVKSLKLFLSLAVCAVWLLASCHRQSSSVPSVAADPETMYQVATLQSLMMGNYDGYVTVDELRSYGDIGLGTFDAIDGEMIVLNDTVYQARYDGSVRIANGGLGVPFASVTHFNTDITRPIARIDSMEQLMQQLAAIVNVNGRNLIYAVRINVDKCDSVVVRSELPQSKPYCPLAETMATAQREFTLRNLSGTIVAVYFPTFFSSQNTPGWHCHFISADRSKGGHMLNIHTTTPSLAELDATPNFNMYMPSDSVFAFSNLDRDLGEDISKVEK